MAKRKRKAHPVLIAATQDDLMELESNGESRKDWWDGEVEEGDEIWLCPESGEVFISHRRAYDCCLWDEDAGAWPDYDEVDWSKDPNYEKILEDQTP